MFILVLHIHLIGIKKDQRGEKKGQERKMASFSVPSSSFLLFSIRSRQIFAGEIDRMMRIAEEGAKATNPSQRPVSVAVSLFNVA